MPKPSLLLTITGVVYFVAALPLLFAPEELLRFAGAGSSTLDVSLLQILGSAIFGFGLLNWSQRYSRIGGIFGRPVVMANLGHTGSAALLLAHICISVPPSVPLIAATACYACIAIAFGIRLFAAPKALP